MYNSGVLNQQLTSVALILANKNPYQAFHEIAQVNVAKAIQQRLGLVPTLEYRIGNTRMHEDVVAGGMVWEVKPMGESGNPQLEAYTAAGGLRRGQGLVDPIEDIPILGALKMRVDFSKDGQANYSFYYYASDGERVEVPSTAAYYFVNEAMKDVAWKTALVVGIALAACVVVDAATVGVGVPANAPILVGVLSFVGSLWAGADMPMVP